MDAARAHLEESHRLAKTTTFDAEDWRNEEWEKI